MLHCFVPSEKRAIVQHTCPHLCNFASYLASIARKKSIFPYSTQHVDGDFELTGIFFSQLFLSTVLRFASRRYFDGFLNYVFPQPATLQSVPGSTSSKESGRGKHCTYWFSFAVSFSWKGKKKIKLSYAESKGSIIQFQLSFSLILLILSLWITFHYLGTDPKVNCPFENSKTFHSSSTAISHLRQQ